jgi:hypothetical protein
MLAWLQFGPSPITRLQSDLFSLSIVSLAASLLHCFLSVRCPNVATVSYGA